MVLFTPAETVVWSVISGGVPGYLSLSAAAGSIVIMIVTLGWNWVSISANAL